MDKIVSTFLDLVKIDSPSGHEDAVREYVFTRLKRNGVISSIDKVGNLFASIKGSGAPLLLSCHLDTVEPGRGVKPIIKNGVITSDGSTVLGADNKAAVAAILETLENLPENHRSIEVIFSVCEETDSGISKFDFKSLKSKTGIVADSATKIGTIITSSPWITDLEIAIVGKSAHASNPSIGINALKIAANSLSKTKLGRLDKDTTFNIGLINGGTATNSIPEKIFLEGEIRSFSESSFKSHRSRVKDIFEAESKKFNGKLRILEKPYSVGYKFSTREPAIKELKKVFDKLGIKTKYMKSFGGSDANAFISQGINVVNIGDGSEHAHTTKESISIKNLNNLKSVFINYVGS